MNILGFQPVSGVRSANGGINAVQRQINHPKQVSQITFWTAQSTQCSAHSTQVSGFFKNGTVDLHKAFNEVQPRASKISCANFQCSFERFEALAIEQTIATSNSVCEAMSVLQREMLGYYKNNRRRNYRKGIDGPDFIVEGLGNYTDITHVEVKNPIGSNIAKTNSHWGVSNLVKQGELIGSKISNQQAKLSNPDFVTNLPHWNKSESFPQSPANMLGLVDTFDFPRSEKSIIENYVINNLTIIFLNNETNI